MDNNDELYNVVEVNSAQSLGLVASLLVARGVAFTIFASGLISLLLAFLLAYRHKVQASSFVLLSAMSAMLFALALVGAGLFDIAIIGYPCLLIFAVILGGVGLFDTLLTLTIVQCSVLVWLNLSGHVVPSTPKLSWEHLIFVQVTMRCS